LCEHRARSVQYSVLNTVAGGKTAWCGDGAALYGAAYPQWGSRLCVAGNQHNRTCGEVPLPTGRVAPTVGGVRKSSPAPSAATALQIVFCQV
jgi:hypothetical protein